MTNIDSILKGEVRAAARLMRDLDDRRPDALGVLFVEFSGESAEEVAELAGDFAGRAPGLPGEPVPGVYLDPRAQIAAWELRRA